MIFTSDVCYIKKIQLTTKVQLSWFDSSKSLPFKAHCVLSLKYLQDMNGSLSGKSVKCEWNQGRIQVYTIHFLCILIDKNVWKGLFSQISYVLYTSSPICEKGCFSQMGDAYITKAYSLIPYDFNFQILIFFFFFFFVALSSKEVHFPKGSRLKSFLHEMRAIFTESLLDET